MLSAIRCVEETQSQKLRHIQSCITQRKTQRPSRTCRSWALSQELAMSSTIRREPCSYFRRIHSVCASCMCHKKCDSVRCERCLERCSHLSCEGVRSGGRGGLCLSVQPHVNLSPFHRNRLGAIPSGYLMCIGSQAGSYSRLIVFESLNSGLESNKGGEGEPT